jgi:UDP-glucose:glycoprotein glucosyltransferase
MDVPEPWNVQQTQSIQDTDNLRCELQSGCSDDDHIDTGEIDSGENMGGKRHITRVEYGLSSLMFFGQCYQTRGSPPNGLQLTLSRNTDLSLSTIEAEEEEEPRHYSDTLVMKNVGYWQLRANPGVWNLNIDKNSRGSEIFDMVDGTVTRGMVRIKGSDAIATKRLVMKDFISPSELLLVKRRLGFEGASLFYDEKQENTEEDVINVFSLATGHLYERFLKIMMLSVTKRTSSKVKFWLFENFLSPTFKASAIAMADRIGCEVEFVTYKWPEWLRGQSEKQRIIWGYKILFLDVLFPLNVKKIIYVDADQVVRGDLKELWDIDLQGAPYGYTPFCTSRETTLGFQFWNTGFWASHLQGKPYHISALYVVDLELFRKTLVGDQLRSIYQSLSADPGSLANLDQDLPNYAQHQVPIFSLPQEWLWCETWCSDETKGASKTIDLCNNPLHKEPKVSMAKRIISGNLFNESWVELDAEIELHEKKDANENL